MPVTINVAKDFSTIPGGRYIKDGPYSGEEFFKNFLLKHFEDKSGYEINIILDGVEGYATAFLDGAFGELAREFSIDICLKRLNFISVEDPLLVDEILHYIRKCHE